MKQLIASESAWLRALWLLHYPWTANGFGWGLAIRAAAVIGT